MKEIELPSANSKPYEDDPAYIAAVRTRPQNWPRIACANLAPSVDWVQTRLLLDQSQRAEWREFYPDDAHACHVLSWAQTASHWHRNDAGARHSLGQNVKSEDA